MGYNSALCTTFLFVATLCVLLPRASAFGAGDIPDFAYLNDKAFRHGDIESILETLAKTAGRSSTGGSGLLGIAASVISAASGPAKFNKSDIKKVYFGNWLRDYSQAMDIAGLTKLSSDTLVLIVSILGFMTFGFSTEEFQVTADRLGVYLPVEHIDNPKGYAEKEGDARKFHHKLRPPVNEQELEFDERTGMKKYMATENQGWDTSTAFIRRTFRACIEYGRRAQGKEGADLWESYRLLGTGLHTMEDLLAHSNWCEVALRKMGHNEVFCHVGDRVTISTPSGPAPPLVTGTFGGADFLHSLLGEAGDKLSQASVTDLSNKMNQAQQEGSPNISALKGILSSFMGGSEVDAKLSEGEQMQQQAQGYNFDPDNAFPPEVKSRLLELLKWHDDVMRQILRKIEMVPGLTDMLDKLSNALNSFIYTVLAPYVTPVLTQTTAVLDEGSKAVIDNQDQYEVFDNPNASDPSHSLLSKDHFGLILNEPAGKIAQILVEYSVNLIVEAWSNNSNADQVIDQILEAFHHPYYNTGRSQIQHKMFNEMERWLGGLGPDEAAQTIQALTKESVRDHKNKRLGSEDQSNDEPGYAPCGHSHGSNYSGGATRPTVVKQNTGANPSYGADYSTGYGLQEGYGGGRQEFQEGYEDSGREESYGSHQDNTYGSGGRQETYGSGRQESYSGGRQEAYSSGRQETVGGYGRQSEVSTGAAYGATQASCGSAGGRQQEVYGRAEPARTYGGGRKDEDDEPKYGGSYRRRDDDDAKPAYGASYGGTQRREGTYGYGGKQGRDDDVKPAYSVRYGGGQRHEDEPGHHGGNQRREDDARPAYGSGYGGSQRRDDDDDGNTPSYGGGYGGRRRDDDDDDYKPKESHGGHHRRDDSGDTPKYGGGYGGRGGDDDYKKKRDKYKTEGSDDEHKKSYGQQGNGQGYAPSYGGSGYGGKRDDSDDDRKKYRKQEESGRSGYTANYGGRNETFGAERMRIGSDSEDDDRKKSRKHGHREYY